MFFRRRLLPGGDRFQDFLVRNPREMVFFVLLVHFIDNLAFLQAAMPDRGQTRIPVMKTIFAQNFILIFRLIDVRKMDPLVFAARQQELFSAYDILFL